MQPIQTTIEEALRLLQQGRIRRVADTLGTIKDIRPAPTDFHLYCGACASSVCYKFLAFEAAERELAIHPTSATAAQLKNFSLSGRDQGRIERDPSLPIISLAAVYDSAQDSYLRTVRALAWQHYGPWELVLAVPYEAALPDAEAAARLDSRVRVLKTFGQSKVASLSAALQQTSGGFQGIIPGSRVVWSDHGLATLASVFQQSPSLQFVTAEREVVNSIGIPISLRNPTPQWSQRLLLDIDNLHAPILKISTSCTLWKKDLFRQAGNTLDTTLQEAFDYELYARFFELTDLTTVNYAVAADEGATSHRSDCLSLRCESEMRIVAARYHRTKKITPRDTVQPLVQTQKSKTELGNAVRPTVPRYVSRVLPVSRLERPKISIVTPSFNQGTYLEQTFDSILSQRDCMVELFVLDGGSNDDSVSTIRKYEKYLAGWRSCVDGGQYFAIMEGLARSTGQIMTWLNSDDVLTHGSLAAVSEIFMERSELRWLTGRIAKLDDYGSVELEPVETYSRKDILSDNFDQPWIQQEGTFWHRDLWNQAGASLDLRWSLAADLELWARFSRLCPLYTSQHPLALHRQHDLRRSQKFFGAYLREAALIIDREQEFSRENSLPYNEPETKAISW